MKHEKQNDARDIQIRVGVSTCLLGEEVRYDGGHKLDRYVVGTLGRFFTWVPVCPEVEIGLPTPRESMRLVGNTAAPRLIAPKSGTDFTERMVKWADQRIDELKSVGLHGFIFKNGSPSSGLYRVRVYDEHGAAQRNGTGIFAAAVRKYFPLLPLEEEGRLHDLPLRENFIERVFTYFRWSKMLEVDPTPGGLVHFHTSQKLTLMAHSPSHYQSMGRMVARAGSASWDELVDEYGRALMEGMSVLGTAGKHVNVMQHLMGFLKDALSADDKHELLGLLEDYRQGLTPLVVPLTMLNHHLSRHPVPDWVFQQVYLNPYPKELMLRNHV